MLLKQVAPVILAAALFTAPAAAFALDRASAQADQGRIAANDTTPAADDTTPKPIKKKLHKSPFKKNAAAKKKVAPTAASDVTPTKTN
jgi:hypothetical protein